MTPNTLQLSRNASSHSVNPKGNPFLSLRAIPFLIVLASFALLPAVRAQVVTTIPVTAPHQNFSIVASPVYSEVYVPDQQNDRVAVIDTTSNQILFFIDTPNAPFGLGVSPDGNTLYVTDDSNNLEAISLITGDIIFVVGVDGGPSYPGISSDGSTVYVPCFFTADVVAVGGPLTGAKIHVGGEPLQAVFNQNNTAAYVSLFSQKNIAVINAATGKVIKIATPTPIYGEAVKGTTLYATGRNQVYLVDTDTNTIVDTINVPLPPGKWELEIPTLTPDGAFLYVPVARTASFSKIGDTVVVINTLTNKVVETLTVGQLPTQIAAAANDIYGYSSNLDDGTVTVFNLAHLPPGSP